MMSGFERFALLICLGLAGCSFGPRTDRAPEEVAQGLRGGAQIYTAQCAKCHGEKGEGVKGKYDESLHGDWSVQRLARYIDRNMPEDEPEQCKGPDAEAVAQYIYDAFYSLEARLRNNPPRVELARLTNLQYLNSVADLVGQFLEGKTIAGEERGLRGSFRKGRGRRGNDDSSERIDREVNFDFTKAGPDGEPLGTNQFSMNWRGSVLPDDTGEHEFIVRSPNGIRLWVNDEEEPLIDAGVASANLTEHRATLRLIGGRAYPLRLEFSKAAKDKEAAVTLAWKGPHTPEQIIPARHLSPDRTRPTFVVSTPFPPDDSSVGYERGVSVSKAWDEATTHAAIATANYVVKHLDQLSRSKLSETNRAEKVQTFCESFITAAFRRPLSEEEQRLYVSAHFQGNKVEDAVKRVVLLALKSPHFLYLGLTDRPADFVVAERLSFGLWDSLPDEELLKAAREGALQTREQIAAQAERMLGDPRARAKMLSFLQHWLQMNRVEDFSKDEQLFPNFTPEIVADLRASLNLFLVDTVWNGSSDYRTLLLADYLFLNKRLANFYGVTNEAADDFVKVAVNPRERSGVLTHPYLLAGFSYRQSSSPIHRGVFLTRNIVGRALKPPPVAVAFKDAEFAPDLTMREKVAELTRPADCQGCHSVINPLGFSLENFDAVGRFRTEEKGKPIDAASEYITDDGDTVRLTGPRDVAEYALNSEHARNGFIEQLFHSVVKQPMLAYGGEVPRQLRHSFMASGFNLRRLLVDIATVAAQHEIEKPAAVASR